MFVIQEKAKNLQNLIPKEPVLPNTTARTNYENHGFESLDIPSMREQLMERGALSSKKFSSQWEGASLKETIDKLAPGAKGENLGGKTIYTTDNSKYSIVYDPGGNYFRIMEKGAPGKRVYTDLGGNIPNNKTVDGRTSGRSQSEYNHVTHHRNIDNAND